MLTRFASSHLGSRRPSISRLSLAVSSAIISLIIALTALPSVARAACADNSQSCHLTATATSAELAPANTANGRCTALIQNSGTTNGGNLCFGGSTDCTATTADFYLGPGDSYWCSFYQGKQCPSGTINVISSNGTTFAYLATGC